MSKRTVIVLAAAVAAGTFAQESNSFKVYGFMDVNAQKDVYEESNFLATKGYVNSNATLAVNHLNTYFDWRSSEKVRVLAELSLNRDPVQSFLSGTRVSPDSAAIYASLEAQLGSSTRAKTLAYLKTTPLAAYGDAVLTHLADSIAIDTLKKSTHAVAANVRANSLQGTPSSSEKDHGISIPRIHADLLLSDLFALRIGKWITPSGIWNVDHGSPIILTINQPNQTAFMPIFPESQTGVQAFGRTSVGDNDYSYNAWVSTGRGSDVLGKDDYAQMPQDPDDWAVGTHLQGDLALGEASLRLGGTVHTGTLRGSTSWTDIKIVGYDASTGDAYTGGLQTSSTTFTTDYYMREWIYGLDTKLKWKNLVLQGEWNHRKVLNLLDGEKETDFNAYYALLGYEIPLTQDASVTPYVMHERISWETPENNQILGVAAYPMDSWSIYMVGLNFGLWGNVHLKTEWAHNVIGAVQNSDRSSAIHNAYGSDDLTIERFAAQLSVSF